MKHRTGLYVSNCDCSECNHYRESLTIGRSQGNALTSSPKTSDYTVAHLTKRSTETFLAIKGGYPKGYCRMTGHDSWFIRVSNHGASLVTTYQTKGNDGQWSGTNEHSEAL